MRRRQGRGGGLFCGVYYAWPWSHAGADPTLVDSGGVAPPRWTREVLKRSQDLRCQPSGLRGYAIERANAEHEELVDIEKAAGKAAKKKAGAKGTKKKK